MKEEDEGGVVENKIAKLGGGRSIERWR